MASWGCTSWKVCIASYLEFTSTTIHHWSSLRLGKENAESSYTANPTIPAIRAITTGSGEDMTDRNNNDHTGCSVCHEDRGHALTSCNAFMSFNPSERLKVVMDLRNCFRCLGRNHQQEDCKKAHLFCSNTGCRGTHHSLLHEAFVTSSRVTKGSGSTWLTWAQRMVGLGTTHFRNTLPSYLSPFVRVIISNGIIEAIALALLDSGSEATLISSSLASVLQLKSSSTTIRFSTLKSTRPIFPLGQTSFSIQSVDKRNSFLIRKAFIVEELNVNKQSFAWFTLKNCWSHLQDLPLEDFNSEQVGLFLGVNTPGDLKKTIFCDAVDQYYNFNNFIQVS